MKKLKDENETLHGRYTDKAAKLNEAKAVLQQSYDEALKLDTMIKMYPDKIKMFQMSQELLSLKEKIQNRSEFEMVRFFSRFRFWPNSKNGVEAETSLIVDENFKLKHESPGGVCSFGLIQRNSKSGLAK